MLVFPVYTIHFRIPGASIHGFTPPPPAPPTVPIPPAFPFVFGKISAVHLELPHTMRWINPLQNKFTYSVEGDGWCIANSGHDVGMLVPHISLPPANLELVVTMLFSKFKVIFGASTVLANGNPVGTYFPFLAPPLFCNFPCGLPAIPFPLNNIIPFPSTVRVGMTFGDFLAGWIKTVIEVGIDLFFSWIGVRSKVTYGGFLGKWKDAFGKFFEKLAPALFGKLGQMIFKKIGEDLFKRLISIPLKGKIDLPPPIGGISIDLDKGKITIGPPGHPWAKWQAYHGPGIAPGGAGADRAGAGLDHMLAGGAPHAH